MPVVVFANPKGGAGKSTSALVLALTLAEAGASVDGNRLGPQPADP